jgi:tetratricopeptide (TPR) repeat protein
LFVGTLLDSWIERGLLGQHEGGWAIEASLRTLETDVPDSLQQLIEKQIAELDPDEQRLLEAASVVGRTFPLAVLASSLPAAEDDLEADCEKLTREGRFIEVAGTEAWGDGALTSRFTFTHDLYVDVLYNRIPAARKTRMHQQAGRAIERAWQGRERERASELALHFQRGLDRERGPRYLQLAAEQALERSAYREAVAHLSASLQLLSGGPPSPERDRFELTLLCRLAPALIATRGYADREVEDNYLRARELAGRIGDQARLSQTLYGLANMYEYRGAYDLAERLANERLALDRTASGVTLMESHELLTCSFLHQGRYRESVEHGEKAMAAFRGAALAGEQLVLAVQAYGWMSGALYSAGRDADALAHSAEAQRLAAASGNELARASAAIQAAFLRFYRRDTEECHRLAELGLAIAREQRFPFHVACGRILSGWWQSTAGHFDESEREIRAGIRTCRAIGALMDMPLFLAILSEPLAGRGDRDGALASLDEALGIIESGRSFFYGPELHRMRALLLGEMGRSREVVLATLRRAKSLAEEQGSPVLAERAAASLHAAEQGGLRTAAVQGEAVAPAIQADGPPAARERRTAQGRRPRPTHTGTV